MLGCGCCGCNIVKDFFDREGGYPAAVGDQWTQVSGSWTVGGNGSYHYLTTTDANALIIANATHPHNEMESIINTGAYGDQPDKFRIIVAYKDVNNYLFCEVQMNDLTGQCGYFQLCQKVSGTITALLPPVFFGLLEYGTVTVCFSEAQKEFSVKALYISQTYTFDTLPFTGGYQVGFGTTATAPTDLKIDQLIWDKHKSTNAPECVDCTYISNPAGCNNISTFFTNYTIGDSPGCSFSEITGDWDIIERPQEYRSGSTYNRFLTCRSDNGICLCVIPEGKQENRHLVNAQVILEDVLIEAGIFINYDPDNGNCYLGTARLNSDNTVTFKLYSNGTLIDTDTQLLMNMFTIITDPYIFNGKITVYLCIEYDGSQVRFYYNAKATNNSYFGTYPHQMIDINATGNTDGLYSGMRVVSNQSTIEPYFAYFSFSRHKSASQASPCGECQQTCTLGAVYHDGPILEPCYLRVDFDNFGPHNCEYPGSMDCDDFNVTLYLSYGFKIYSRFYYSSAYYIYFCSHYGPIEYTAWCSLGFYGIDVNTFYLDIGIHLIQGHYIYWPGGPFNVPPTYRFERWYTSPPNMFNFFNEDIPFYGPSYGYCINPNSLPTCKVSYGDLDVS